MALVRFSSGECNLLLANHHPETQKFRNYRNISGKQLQNFSCTNRILYRAPLFKHFNLCEIKLHIPMSTAGKESLFSFPRHSGTWSALLQPASPHFSGWISHHLYIVHLQSRGATTEGRALLDICLPKWPNGTAQGHHSLCLNKVRGQPLDSPSVHLFLSPLRPADKIRCSPVKRNTCGLYI